jgi:RNA polymerase sigma-70 factor, ECF subfamily
VTSLETTAPESKRECVPQTLGRLLYADASRARLPEADWVALVSAIAARDQRALRALYERAHRIVFTLIMRITGDRETAEELTLDVFHDVWRRACAYDAAGGTVVGWIMNQARSRAIDRVRFEQRKKRVKPHTDEPLRPAAANGCDEALSLEHQGRLLRNAMSVLTPEERQAIEIAYFSELTYSEVASRLDQPLGTVKTRIRSALRKLRQALPGEAKEQP